MGVFNASTSPPKEGYAVTETNVFELTQPGTFSDPLTEVLRNGACGSWGPGERRNRGDVGSPDGCNAFRCDTCAAPFEGVGHDTSAGQQRKSRGQTYVSSPMQ